MNQTITMYKWNRLLLPCFWLFLGLYAGFSLLTPLSFSLPAMLIGIATGLFLLVLLRFRINERILQHVLLLSMNLYIFLAVWDSTYPTAYTFLILPLLAASFYVDAVPVLVLMAITLPELVLAALFAPVHITLAVYPVLGPSVLLLITAIVILVLVHSVYSGKFWRAMENKNRSMEQALLSREGYLQLFFGNAQDAIAVFDLNDRVIDINPAFEELYGWTREEAIGRKLPIVPPEHREEANDRLRNLFKGQSYSLLETTDMRRDGSYFDAEVTLSSIRDENGKVIATSVISRDISYRKETEKLIVQSEKLKLAGEMAAGVAHEIRNPMTVISGFVQMMHHDTGHPYQPYTKLILSEIERINLIIGEFLILAKPQAVQFSKVSLRQTLEEILLLYGPEFNMQGVIFRETWETEDFAVRGEKNQLKQVFINLIRNAIEALGNEGKISLHAEKAADRTVIIRLKDNGSGIPPEVLTKIFEPFYTTKSTGTGLGLIISQRIIQDHGGSLSVLSEQGKGTEVVVQLPLI
ncbi:ATP-binding protein [Planococcus lenghuensis]|uniref:histidine kinase n=1 Tax=Planococcus lenghuensis TaxID=2213202 RepID=A0A1Q2L0D8_9BACL|nr:ATP-binding protein [Planococcus lenghuensis]AQQ53883.1 hypothetical protein B0X71_12805 [Planococcus lenghuensis]